MSGSYLEDLLLRRLFFLSLLADLNFPTSFLNDSPMMEVALCPGDLARERVCCLAGGGGMSAAKRVLWYSFLFVGVVSGGGVPRSGDGEGDGVARFVGGE